MYIFAVMKDVQLLVKMEKGTKTKLSKIAKSSNRTMSDYVRLLIEYATANNIKL